MENEEIKRKIKRYGILYEEKKAYIKAEQNKVVYDDTLEQSVTKKIGYTELGQLSEGRTDTAMQFNKSINNEHVRKQMQFALGNQSSASLIQVNHGQTTTGMRQASENSDLSENLMDAQKSIEGV